MADGTGIEWTDATWNPIRGCSRVSEGCRNCYAERVAARFSGPGMPYEGLARMTSSGPRWTGAIKLLDQAAGDPLTQPLRWKRPRRIFVNSMSDLFHEGLPFEAIDRIVAVMAAASQHTFQVLTKRPARMAEYLASRATSMDFLEAGARLVGHTFRFGGISLLPWPLPNVWWGFSAEDQDTFDTRHREAIRSRHHMAVLWVSLEPLLGPIELRTYTVTQLGSPNPVVPVRPETLQALGDVARKLGANAMTWHGQSLLDWVVAGGESGPGARPPHPAWFRSLRDSCVNRGIPFLFKQWGEWEPGGRQTPGPEALEVSYPNHNKRLRGTAVFPDGQVMAWAGKKNAGRQLDGATWDEYPTLKGAA